MNSQSKQHDDTYSVCHPIDLNSIEPSTQPSTEDLALSFLTKHYDLLTNNRIIFKRLHVFDIHSICIVFTLYDTPQDHVVNTLLDTQGVDFINIHNLYLTVYIRDTTSLLNDLRTFNKGFNNFVKNVVS